MKNAAVLLLSGGLDSAANLAMSFTISTEVKVAITINYGQKSAKKEIEAASKLCRHFQIEHKIIEINNFSEWVEGKSALLNENSQIPQPSDLDEMSVITKTANAVWVPNRNGMFISIAAAVAESRGLNAVLVGFNAEEAVTFPDNSNDYMKAMTESLRFSTQNQVQVLSATVHFTKSEIVKKLSELDFPFSLLWSCYRGGEKHCGICESCLRLKRALNQHNETGIFLC